MNNIENTNFMNVNEDIRKAGELLDWYSSLPYIEKLKNKKKLDEELQKLNCSLSSSDDERTETNISRSEPEPTTLNNPNVVIDFHHMNIPTAKEMFYRAYNLALSQKSEKIIAITGKGLHSFKKEPVIKQTIINLCEDEGMFYEEAPNNSGMLYCYMKKLDY